MTIVYSLRQEGYYYVFDQYYLTDMTDSRFRMNKLFVFCLNDI